MEIDKIKFKKIIDLFKTFNIYGNYHFVKQYIHIINIITGIIKKYHNKDDWFLKTFLTSFFERKKVMFNEFNDYDDYKEYCLFEFSNILYIIRKYKISEIFELFIKKLKIKSQKFNDLDDWIKKNTNLFFDYICYLVAFKPLLINDIKVPTCIEHSKNTVEQLLYVTFHYNDIYIFIKHN